MEKGALSETCTWQRGCRGVRLLVCLSVVVAWKHNTLGQLTQFIHAEAVERVSLSSILLVTPHELSGSEASIFTVEDKDEEAVRTKFCVTSPVVS